MQVADCLHIADGHALTFPAVGHCQAVQYHVGLPAQPLTVMQSAVCRLSVEDHCTVGDDVRIIIRRYQHVTPSLAHIVFQNRHGRVVLVPLVLALAVHLCLGLQDDFPDGRNLFCSSLSESVLTCFHVCYFMNTKYTARIRQTKAAMWFQWKVWPLNTNMVKAVNTVRETTSWITLS